MSTMRRPKKRITTRSIAAATLICASFLSAYLLSAMANRTQLLWSARTPLAPGTEISLSSLVSKRVAIPDGISAYISADTDINHFFVLKSIGSGELLPASALSANGNTIHSSAVPVSVHSSDLPSDLAVGEVVNLYHVGDSHLAKEIGPPVLVLSNAYILGIDRKGQNLGGDLTLTISMNSKYVMQVLDATASGRVVVVRMYG